jgi:hypothetical protein
MRRSTLITLGLMGLSGCGGSSDAPTRSPNAGSPTRVGRASASQTERQLRGVSVPDIGRIVTARCFVSPGHCSVTTSTGTQANCAVAGRKGHLEGVYCAAFTTFDESRPRAPYRFVGQPVALIGHGRRKRFSSYIYMVYVRLNRPVPQRAGHLVGAVALDGASGGNGHPVLRRLPGAGRYCYRQRVDDDFAYTPTLVRPRQGAAVRLTLLITAPVAPYRPIGHLERNIHLKAPTSADTRSKYLRQLGCFSGHVH